MHDAAQSHAASIQQLEPLTASTTRKKENPMTRLSKIASITAWLVAATTSFGFAQEFKAGKRQATVMHQHAKGYTDQEIEVLAEYFSRQKRP